MRCKIDAVALSTSQHAVLPPLRRRRLCRRMGAAATAEQAVISTAMSAEHLCELLSALTRRGASLSPLNSTQELDELADSFHSLALGVRERGNAEECEALGRFVVALAKPARSHDCWHLPP